MDEKYYEELVKIRLERARELLEESEALVNKDSYKSANNRAFYAVEKGIKALLASIKTDAETHTGAEKMFNYHFIHNGNGIFTPDDYRLIRQTNQIRNASDYDDFYITSKEEARRQVQNARYLIDKIERYLTGEHSADEL